MHIKLNLSCDILYIKQGMALKAKVKELTIYLAN